MDGCYSAALRLHRFLTANHLRAEGLAGPDVGIRINYRVGRFVKAYLPWVPWNDDLYYVQGQAYWALANWRLYDMTGEDEYQRHAAACMRGVMARQRADGSWEYPNPEWKGRIATAEGNWGSLALLETFRRTGEYEFLESALRWYEHLTARTGFQRMGDELAVNYFAAPGKERVCNNSAFTLRLLAELADVTGEAPYLETCPGMLRFLSRAQTPGGELPYTAPGEGGGRGRLHFQCCQYNAFQFLDLVRYWELTGDTAAREIVTRQVNFLRASQADDGHARYQCGSRSRQVTYHAAVLAAALAKAGEIGLTGYTDAAARSYRYVLRLQRKDGGFPHSRCEYVLLADRRSYPRNLAMILFHLLHACPVSPKGRNCPGPDRVELRRA